MYKAMIAILAMTADVYTHTHLYVPHGISKNITFVNFVSARGDANSNLSSFLPPHLCWSIVDHICRFLSVAVVYIFIVTEHIVFFCSSICRPRITHLRPVRKLRLRSLLNVAPSSRARTEWLRSGRPIFEQFLVSCSPYTFTHKPRPIYIYIYAEKTLN